MSSISRRILLVCLCFFFCFINLSSAYGDERSFINANESSYITVTPKELDNVILNPGKGWVLYGEPSKQSKDTIARGTTGYERWSWSDIEPQENTYNWSIIDNFIKKWRSYGKKASFGIMCASTSVSKAYVTPQWVFDGGAKYTTTYTEGSVQPRILQYVPVWNDEVFIKKLRAFIKALSNRYDGNPNIAFIDIRSYGNWGEGHVYGLDRTNNPSIVLSNGELRQHLQLYLDVFHKTQLILPWGDRMHNTDYDWAVEQSIGIRRDGIMKYSDGSECIRAFGYAPAVYEFVSSYGNLVRNNLWNSNRLRMYVQIGKPSYIGMGYWGSDSVLMLSEEKDLIDKLANKMGYHFILTNAVIPQKIQLGLPFNVNFDWLNDGVAPIYEPCFASLGLMDRFGSVRYKVWLDNSLPSKWMPGKVSSDLSEVSFKGMPIGNYKLVIGLFKNKSDLRPTYKIANEGLNSNGWYTLGKVRVIQG